MSGVYNGLWSCNDLVEGHKHKEHVITMDNYFSSISLFKDLAEVGKYATGMVQRNRVGLMKDLKDTKSFSKVKQGTLLWKMHKSKVLLCILQKDKRPVLLLSTHAPPIQGPCLSSLLCIPC